MKSPDLNGIGSSNNIYDCTLMNKAVLQTILKLKNFKRHFYMF